MTVVQPTTICYHYNIMIISLKINRPLSGTAAVQELDSSKT